MPNLILTRALGQSIVIDCREYGKIEITVVRTGNFPKLAIEADPRIRIDRKEVAAAIAMGLTPEQSRSLRREHRDLSHRAEVREQVADSKDAD